MTQTTLTDNRYGPGVKQLLRPELDPSPRRVRVVFGGETIADSKQVLLVREPRRTPIYVFPRDDVRLDLLAPSPHRAPRGHFGQAAFWNVRVGDRVAENAAWAIPAPPAELSAIADHVAFDWGSMDAWYEEAEEVFVHPRDPYHRVDVLQSDRHVQVIVGGETVAETHRPRLLFETGLPTRYYIPADDVRMDLLQPTDTTTRCPYKGSASYWSVDAGGKVAKDLVWGYKDPVPECPKIKGWLCFFNEKVDRLIVDGEVQPVPKTPWS